MKKAEKTIIKKTTAMMAASMMIMSLVLSGCGTTSAATSASSTTVETEAETQTEAEKIQDNAAQDDTGFGTKLKCSIIRTATAKQKMLRYAANTD